MLEERIEKYWTTRASGFSASINNEMNSFKRNAWKSIIKRLAKSNGDLKALDVGTGPGFFAILMAELGYEVIAVDNSENMLMEAKKNADYAGYRITFAKGDAQTINMPDGSFDLIISRNLVWTLTEPLQAYKEWYRLLSPAGRVIVFDANWYLRLSDNELQKKYEHSKIIARERGLVEKVTEEQHRECEAIARRLPLTYENRPEWDKNALIECGFDKIIIESNINDLVYDENERIVNDVYPMFAICACK